MVTEPTMLTEKQASSLSGQRKAIALSRCFEGGEDLTLCAGWRALHLGTLSLSDSASEIFGGTESL